ncbi:TIGR00270 family protein [archaeon]|nr:TIGR00270 family protein [archaeon]|tara:strand:+ start:883 stop:1347 length:465 start_codon:yes stop_codon:yes gene_type:complete
MPACEMCGKREETLTQAVIEGSMLTVCQTCLDYGNAVILAEPKLEPLVQKEIAISGPESIQVIIPDAGATIKTAREKKGLKQDDLAKLLAEKSSAISSIESGKAQLSLKLAKKFEQFFGITLVSEHTEIAPPEKVNLTDPDLTIGDLIKYKKRR